jgi:hypothetical protein
MNTWKKFSKLKQLNVMGWTLSYSNIRQIFKICPEILGFQNNTNVFLRSNKLIKEIAHVPINCFWVPSLKNKIEFV